MDQSLAQTSIAAAIEEEIDTLTEEQIAVVFLLNFALLYARPADQQDTPQEMNAQTHEQNEILVKILKKFQSAHRIECDPSFDTCTEAGEYWATKLADQAQEKGYIGILAAIASLFDNFREQLEIDISSVDAESYQEYLDFGHFSWLHVQRMDYYFFEKAFMTLMEICSEMKGREELQQMGWGKYGEFETEVDEDTDEEATGSEDSDDSAGYPGSEHELPFEFAEINDRFTRTSQPVRQKKVAPVTPPVRVLRGGRVVLGGGMVGAAGSTSSK